MKQPSLIGCLRPGVSFAFPLVRISGLPRCFGCGGVDAHETAQRRSAATSQPSERFFFPDPASSGAGFSRPVGSFVVQSKSEARGEEKSNSAKRFGVLCRTSSRGECPAASRVTPPPEHSGPPSARVSFSVHVRASLRWQFSNVPPRPNRRVGVPKCSDADRTLFGNAHRKDHAVVPGDLAEPLYVRSWNLNCVLKQPAGCDSYL
jgi:hypothetical protein